MADQHRPSGRRKDSSSCQSCGWLPLSASAPDPAARQDTSHPGSPGVPSRGHLPARTPAARGMTHSCQSELAPGLSPVVRRLSQGRPTSRGGGGCKHRVSNTKAKRGRPRAWPSRAQGGGASESLPGIAQHPRPPAGNRLRQDAPSPACGAFCLGAFYKRIPFCIWWSLLCVSKPQPVWAPPRPGGGRVRGLRVLC